MDIYKTQEYKEYTINLSRDLDPESPREWDNLGKMVCFHRKHNLGDKHNYSSPQEFLDDINEEEVFILPLYLYDHSVLTISTSPFSCPWDSGQVGWIFVPRHKADLEGLTDDQVMKTLQSEVETYDAFLRGDVFGYVIQDLNEEVIDSCWGFYDAEYCLSEAKSIVEYNVNQFGRQTELPFTP